MDNKYPNWKEIEMIFHKYLIEVDKVDYSDLMHTQLVPLGGGKRLNSCKMLHGMDTIRVIMQDLKKYIKQYEQEIEMPEYKYTIKNYIDKYKDLDEPSKIELIKRLLETITDLDPTRTYVEVKSVIDDN